VSRSACLIASLALAIGASALPMPPSDARAATQRVTIRTEDGIALSATWFEPSARPAPAVILVHMLHRSRRDFEPLAQRLASDGIGALAIDLRGHGDSTGGVPPADDGYASMVIDVRAARRYLSSRTDVQQTRVGMAGASLGASLAVLAAAGDATVSSLALLSPSLDYRGLRIEAPLRKIGRPVLLVASDDDPYAMRSARDLQKAAGGPRELLRLAQAGHGTTMLSRDPGLVRVLVDWFRRTLT
jgi:alpha-beta hydrolase superfamily lysophospholipase